DARLRRLCQTVLPVAGLLAQASATRTEAEYRALTTLAALPRTDCDALTLTVDRFVADANVDVTPLEREDLLARFGLYGVRVSIRLIRAGGATSSTDLATHLRELSGIEQLRSTLQSLFAARSDVL